jgi:hypothetical protein
MKIWQPIKWVVALPALTFGILGLGLAVFGYGCLIVAKYMLLLVED